MASNGALPEMAKLLAVPLNEIAVIDDGVNDIAISERSGLSISMGNASPEVRRGADVVTGSNGEDASLTRVERFILGGGRSNAHDGIARAGVPAWQSPRVASKSRSSWQSFSRNNGHGHDRARERGPTRPIRGGKPRVEFCSGDKRRFVEHPVRSV